MDSQAYTNDIPFFQLSFPIQAAGDSHTPYEILCRFFRALMFRAHIVTKPMPTLFANRGRGEDKEETQRVSDAVNDKMESDEALPERSDRERNEPVSGVWGRRAPTVPLVRGSGAKPTEVTLMPYQLPVRRRVSASISCSVSPQRRRYPAASSSSPMPLTSDFSNPAAISG